MRNLTKMTISQATFGVRRPTSTTFVDIFKGYNAEVYMKIKFQDETGQNCKTDAKLNMCRPGCRPRTARYRPRHETEVEER